jgi:hypothetical protein
MAAYVYKSPDSFRLRKTDVYGMPDKLLDDEEATLDQEGVVDGDTLYIEEGKAPVKGQISVQFNVYKALDGISEEGIVHFENFTNQCTRRRKYISRP